MDKQEHQADETLQRGPGLIQANQKGKIAPLQMDWLMRDVRAERQRQMRMVYISALVFLVITVVFALMPYLPIPIIAPPLIWLFGVILWYIWIRYKENSIMQDIKEGKAQGVTGIISKSTKQGYHVRVNGIDYNTSPDMYKIFVEGQPYNVYFTPKSKIVLSAESLTN